MMQRHTCHTMSAKLCRTCSIHSSHIVQKSDSKPIIMRSHAVPKLEKLAAAAVKSAEHGKPEQSGVGCSDARMLILDVGEAHPLSSSRLLMFHLWWLENSSNCLRNC